MVRGALSFKLAIHPTHENHPKYEQIRKSLGNRIKPIFQINKLFTSLTILIVILRKIVIFLLVRNILIMMIG